MDSNTRVEILLVEDNPFDIKLALEAFNTHRVVNSIHVVRDGQEALEFMFATDRYANRVGQPLPRFVLLDLKLPKIDGLEVLRRIKSDPLTQMVPVIVMTSSREECDIVGSYQIGVNSYIVKPVDFEKFIEVSQNLGLYWLLLNEPPPATT